MKRIISILLASIFILFIHFYYPNNFTWERINSPKVWQISQIAFGCNEEKYIIASPWKDTLDSTIGNPKYRIYKLDKNGTEWENIFEYNWPINMTVDSNSIYVCGFYEIVKSSVNDYVWESLGVDTLQFSAVHTIAKAPNGYFYIGANNSNYCSKDDGKSWIKLDIEYQVESFLFLEDGIILAGVTSGQFPNPPQFIYRSTDYGNNWNKVLNAEKTRGWSFVANKKGIVFAATSEYDSTNGGIYKSTDSGLNWIRVNNGFPSRKINSLVINSAGNLFAGIYGAGLFCSTDDGMNWIECNNNVSDLRILTLAIDKNDILYFGTGNSGLTSAESDTANFYSGSTITSIQQNEKEIFDSFDLAQNYPNPFNPVTTINYFIPKSSYVKIKVYDSLGKEIATLVNGNKPSGNHSIVFNAGELASGIYFYRLEASNYTNTKKFVLLK